MTTEKFTPYTFFIQERDFEILPFVMQREHKVQYAPTGELESHVSEKVKLMPDLQRLPDLAMTYIIMLCVFFVAEWLLGPPIWLSGSIALIGAFLFERFWSIPSKFNQEFDDAFGGGYKSDIVVKDIIETVEICTELNKEIEGADAWHEAQDRLYCFITSTRNNNYNGYGDEVDESFTHLETVLEHYECEKHAWRYSRRLQRMPD